MVAIDWPDGCPDTQKSRRFVFVLCNFGQVDASTDIYRSALDDKMCSYGLVQKFAGGLRVHVGDALRSSNIERGLPF